MWLDPCCKHHLKWSIYITEKHNLADMRAGSHCAKERIAPAFFSDARRRTMAGQNLRFIW